MAQSGTPPPPHLPTSHRIWTNPKTGPWDKWGDDPLVPRGYPVATPLGPRHTCMPSFILIRPTLWPQYTNVTDRQTGQRTDSIGRTVLQTVAQKRLKRSICRLRCGLEWAEVCTSSIAFARWCQSARRHSSVIWAKWLNRSRCRLGCGLG